MFKFGFPMCLDRAHADKENTYENMHYLFMCFQNDYGTT